MRFIFSTGLLGDEELIDVVVFEKLFYNDLEIASHEDITNQDQTVTVSYVPDEEIPRNPWIPSTGANDCKMLVVLSASIVGVTAINSRKKKRRNK